MLVLIHLEWLRSEGVTPQPTQLAALRVDARWAVTDEFHTLIRQPDETATWTHAGFGQISPHRYRCAPEAQKVTDDFRAWLRSDDVFLWWDEATGEALADLLDFRAMDGRAIEGRFLEIVMDNMVMTGAPYRLAQRRGIVCPQPMHVAENEVEALRRLLEMTRIDQALLLTDELPPMDQIEKQRIQALRYQLDALHKRLHTNSCPRVRCDLPKRMDSLQLPFQKHVRACSCCAAEYRREAAKRNAETVSQTKARYVYLETSKVFHARKCGIVRQAYSGELLGEMNYDACISKGLRPCRVCQPTPTASKPKKAKNMLPQLKSDAQRAMRRYNQVRSSTPPDKHIPPQEYADWWTLNNSAFIFFAGKGYTNYHLCDCPRLKGLSHIQGFATVKQAKAQLLTPCKHCRPSAKHELTVTIPDRSIFREGETVEMLDALCQKAGYDHVYEQSCYYITTHIGKWRFKPGDRPIRLHHINLMRSSAEGEYHLQPKMFLSLRDAFEYIRAHDEGLGRGK